MEKTDYQGISIAGLLVTGDAGSPRLLVDAYRPAIYSYCARMLGNSDDAEDATQECFLQALRDAAALRSPEKLREWLFGIARHRVLMALRTRKNGRREKLTDDLWDEETPHTIAEANDIRSHVRRAIAALAPAYREMVVLRDYNSYSYAEIAALTGLTENVVRVRLHRARQALIRKLTPVFLEEDSREL